MWTCLAVTQDACFKILLFLLPAVPRKTVDSDPLYSRDRAGLLPEQSRRSPASACPLVHQVEPNTVSPRPAHTHYGLNTHRQREGKHFLNHQTKHHGSTCLSCTHSDHYHFLSRKGSILSAYMQNLPVGMWRYAVLTGDSADILYYCHHRQTWNF